MMTFQTILWMIPDIQGFTMPKTNGLTERPPLNGSGRKFMSDDDKYLFHEFEGALYKYKVTIKPPASVKDGEHGYSLKFVGKEVKDD